MSLSIYQASVPVFIRALESLRAELAKAQETGDDDLPGARLAPDMLSLAGQVQRASDTAKMAVHRLGGPPAPAMADDETTLSQLQARMTRTIDYLRGVPPEALDGAETLVITLPFGKFPPFTGTSFLLTFALPNLFFHVATAHGILRQKGVAVGKLDYLGPYA